ncbi:MAG: mannonate dehydratase [Frankiales bacterium]|nr:mannonate dehydratase [Frankiales bacterium]
MTLKIETDEGIYGIGDATLNGRELAVASYLSDHLVPMLIGRDPSSIEDLWQTFYRGAYWRRGPVTMTAIAAIDVALWDIKGKALNTPVWNLLGGRVRDGIMVYSHVAARSVSDAVDLVKGKIEEGFRATRVQVAVPGIPEMYGVPGQYDSRAKNQAALPFTETSWSTEKYLRFVPEMFRQVREGVGFDIALLHDAHHRLVPSQAGWLGKRLEDIQLLWLEDAVSVDLQSSYRQIRAATTTPLAVGEMLNSLYDSDQLIREQLIDYIRSTVVHAGGITGLRKIASYAEPFLVRTGCHGASDLSPVTMSAAAHYSVSTHNAAVQEFMGFPEQAHEVFSTGYSVTDGLLSPSDSPGLGVDIDEKAANRFPYERAYLPLSRKEDGSIWNW